MILGTQQIELVSRDCLDQFIAAMRALARRAKAGDARYFHEAPHLAPRRRMDETAAARHPVLRWRAKEPAPGKAA